VLLDKVLGDKDQNVMPAAGIFQSQQSPIFYLVKRDIYHFSYASDKK